MERAQGSLGGGNHLVDCCGNCESPLNWNLDANQCAKCSTPLAKGQDILVSKEKTLELIQSWIRKNQATSFPIRYQDLVSLFCGLPWDYLLLEEGTLDSNELSLVGPKLLQRSAKSKREAEPVSESLEEILLAALNAHGQGDRSTWGQVSSSPPKMDKFGYMKAEINIHGNHAAKGSVFSDLLPPGLGLAFSSTGTLGGAAYVLSKRSDKKHQYGKNAKFYHHDDNQQTVLLLVSSSHVVKVFLMPSDIERFRDKSTHKTVMLKSSEILLVPKGWIYAVEGEKGFVMVSLPVELLSLDRNYIEASEGKEGGNDLGLTIGSNREIALGSSHDSKSKDQEENERGEQRTATAEEVIPEVPRAKAEMREIAVNSNDKDYIDSDLMDGKMERTASETTDEATKKAPAKKEGIDNVDISPDQNPETSSQSRIGTEAGWKRAPEELLDVSSSNSEDTAPPAKKQKANEHLNGTGRDTNRRSGDASSLDAPNDDSTTVERTEEQSDPRPPTRSETEEEEGDNVVGRVKAGKAAMAKKPKREVKNKEEWVVEPGARRKSRRQLVRCGFKANCRQGFDGGACVMWILSLKEEWDSCERFPYIPTDIPAHLVCTSCHPLENNPPGLPSNLPPMFKGKYEYGFGSIVDYQKALEDSNDGNSG